MSTLKVTTLQDTAGANSSTSAEIYSGRAKAWVNFNGQGTVAIRADFNVNTITDNDVGLYTVNMTNALSDTNFCLIGTTGSATASAGTANSSLQDTSGSTARTTSSVQFRSNNSTGTNTDQAYISVAIFR